ncbi:hypothetical protein A2774_05585 [Candidatus Roizmanbacteria bacterium RIFCSPHIGHO2_01_FULL_39_12c]|uniref:Uncharacterized protein n=1 Tax=Candidatus Roizmanbacteria bacterium RIFCSPHIGHO2_01_FULL_39_12c TaxID=1802031 RepID=A0A1F7GEY9_9BACT|nr:MAG: hypothetical protein A2774_05585 [Candidatus Roizmanbacteria bacterium RIFCSPHIGHO2_01_FULL_39_12c]
MKIRQLLFLILIFFSLGLLVADKFATDKVPDAVLIARFEKLSRNGNSSCSGNFSEGINSLSDNNRLQGSCCSPMNYHRYSEQIRGLQEFKKIPEIPQDPYDILVKQAKNLMSHYDDILSFEQEKAYDFAMQNSHEQGPCCCKCWRWYVYGGLGKILIRKYNFTGERLAKIWNLSDGCGGAGDHVNHS